MDQKDARRYFDEWLTAYSDHLGMVCQGRGIDSVQPVTTESPLAAPPKKSNNTMTPQRKPRA